MIIGDSSVLPFEGGSDEGTLGIAWDRCVVRVGGNASGIGALPGLLRAMTRKEFMGRRAACRSIFRRILGSREEYQRAFFTLLRVRALGVPQPRRMLQRDDTRGGGAAAAKGWTSLNAKDA